MELQLKNPKTAEITYLEGKKQQRRRHLRYLEVSKLEKGVRGFSKAKEQNQKLMEHFQPLKTNNKLCLVYSQSKLQQHRYS